MKYNYYVGILYTHNEVRYVTGIDPETKTAVWSHGEKPKAFKKVRADDLVLGLTCNGIPAVLVQAPEYLELRNDWEVEA